MRSIHLISLVVLTALGPTSLRADELPTDAAQRIDLFKGEVAAIQLKADLDIKVRLAKLIEDLKAMQQDRLRAGEPGKAAVIGEQIQKLKDFAAKANNLVINGSFEDGPDAGTQGFKSLDEGSTEIKGWTVTRGQIDYVGSYWQAADGTHSIDLQGSTGTIGGIKQTFPTTKGQKYRVTFALAGNPDKGPTEKILEVNAADQTKTFTFDITGKTRQDMGWVTVTWEFTAKDDMTTLEFYAPRTEPSGWGPVIDNVSVVSVSK